MTTTLVSNLLKHQGLVVQRLGDAIHWINCYPVDKCWQKKLQYTIHWIVVQIFCGWYYPSFEQLGWGGGGAKSTLTYSWKNPSLATAWSLKGFVGQI